MFFRGAQLGHRGSELQLGILYQVVPSPTRDYVKSFAWLTVTANRGEPISQEAKSFLAELEHKLTEDQRKKGTLLARQLTEKYGSVTAFSN